MLAITNKVVLFPKWLDLCGMLEVNSFDLYNFYFLQFCFLTIDSLKRVTSRRLALPEYFK